MLYVDCFGEPTPTTTGWKHKECTECGKKGSRIEVYYDEFVPVEPETPDTPETPDVPETPETPETPDEEPAPTTLWQRIVTAIKNFFTDIIDKIKKLFA